MGEEQPIVIHNPRLSAEASAGIAIGSLLALLVALAFAIARRTHHRRTAAAAREASARAGERRDGPAIVAGTVHVDDRRPAIVLRVREHGTERKHKGKWSHTWKEIEREVEARTFDVVCADGARVRVVPGDDVFLVDRLVVDSRSSRAFRERVAKLDHGERVVVDGVPPERERPDRRRRGVPRWRQALDAPAGVRTADARLDAAARGEARALGLVVDARRDRDRPRAGGLAGPARGPLLAPCDLRRGDRRGDRAAPPLHHSRPAWRPPPPPRGRRDRARRTRRGVGAERRARRRVVGPARGGRSRAVRRAPVEPTAGAPDRAPRRDRSAARRGRLHRARDLRLVVYAQWRRGHAWFEQKRIVEHGRGPLDD